MYTSDADNNLGIFHLPRINARIPRLSYGSEEHYRVHMEVCKHGHGALALEIIRVFIVCIMSTTLASALGILGEHDATCNLIVASLFVLQLLHAKQGSKARSTPPEHHHQYKAETWSLPKKYYPTILQDMTQVLRISFLVMGRWRGKGVGEA